MPFRRFVLLLALMVAPLVLPSCGSSTFAVENRQTPIHVWITSVEGSEAGGSLDLIVTVGDLQVVSGPVRFPEGVPTVAMPTIYRRSGPTTITAVVRGASAPTTTRVTIAGESWVQVIVTGLSARVRATDSPPNPWGR